MLAKVEVGTRAMEDDGWRRGKPVEDPGKTKRWGLVTAQPSEYLVHVRRGRVREKSSGQGATCFKWPWDAVAIVPTSLQRLAFRADQVTREKVGVEVVGLAVYRIADPLLAFRVLNFSFPERAQEKLEETLGAMFVGATRRLVANLGIDDCLQKRKEALATELLREIAPVVGGSGRADDATSRGWGVVLDTIEIQEVRVLSERLFDAMQAPYRARLDREAREARASAQMEVESREAACKRAVEEARLAADAAVRERQLLLARAEDERRAEDALLRLVLEDKRARAELSAHALQLEAKERAAALARVDWIADAERRRALAEVTLVVGRADAEVALAAAQVERVRAEAHARVVLAEQLPQVAAAVGGKFGEIKLTQIGGESAGFGAIAQAVMSLVDAVSDRR